MSEQERMVDIVMPRLDTRMTEGMVVQWARNQGDAVEPSETVVTVSGSRVEAELPAGVKGVLTKVNVQQGQTVPVGTVLGVVEAAPGQDIPHQPHARASGNDWWNRLGAAYLLISALAAMVLTGMYLDNLRVVEILIDHGKTFLVIWLALSAPLIAAMVWRDGHWVEGLLAGALTLLGCGVLFMLSSIWILFLAFWWGRILMGLWMEWHGVHPDTPPCPACGATRVRHHEQVMNRPEVMFLLLLALGVGVTFGAKNALWVVAAASGSLLVWLLMDGFWTRGMGVRWLGEKRFCCEACSWVWLESRKKPLGCQKAACRAAHIISEEKGLPMSEQERMVDLVMPRLDARMTEGMVVQWARNQGDAVEPSETVVTVSGSHVEAELPAGVKGVLTKVNVQQGQTVPVGTVLAVVEAVPGQNIPHQPHARASGNDKVGATASRISFLPALVLTCMLLSLEEILTGSFKTFLVI